MTALGSFSVLSLVTASAAGYLLLRRNTRALALLVGSAIGGLLLSSALKVVFARPRPEAVPHLTKVVTDSFPSGHAAMAAIVYLTLAAVLARLVAEPRVGTYFVALALTVTVLVGLSRLYLGVHYPSDVLAGWALGLSWATSSWLVARVLERRGKV